MDRHLPDAADGAGQDPMDTLVRDALAPLGIVPASISHRPDGTHVLVPVWQADRASQALVGAQGITQVETTDTLFVTVLVRDAPASRCLRHRRV